VIGDRPRAVLVIAQLIGAPLPLRRVDVAQPLVLAIPAAVPAAGEGPRLYPESFGEPIGPRYPAAAMLAEYAAERLAAGAVLPPAEPLYLRRPDARVPGPPKRVSRA